MADFTMPALGADMTRGKVVQWLVSPGDVVRRGDVIAIVETHKGTIDVECFLEGVIRDLVALDVDLPVGAVLAHVLGPGEPATEQARPETELAPPGAATGAEPPPPGRLRACTQQGARVRMTPAARRRVQQLGLDPRHLQGSGPGGALTLADVERRAAPASPEKPQRSGAFDQARMREAIALAMTRSKREIPHYYLSTTIDFAAATSWLATYNAQREPAARLLPAVLMLKATALALVEVPQLNGFYRDGAYRPGTGVHIGWAISLRGGGLVAPAIHDADRQSLPVLMDALRDLVRRARAGGLRSSEMTDPTVTVTSLGERGAESVLGIIYPPQVAIVGFGRVVERP